MEGGLIWPAYALDEEYRFFDDVSGYRDRFEGSAGNVFAGGDEIDVETCAVNSLGKVITAHLRMTSVR
jgi:hypothetical protein